MGGLFGSRFKELTSGTIEGVKRRTISPSLSTSESAEGFYRTMLASKEYMISRMPLAILSETALLLGILAAPRSDIFALACY